jgi:hypothetical protein
MQRSKMTYSITSSAVASSVKNGQFWTGLLLHAF